MATALTRYNFRRPPSRARLGELLLEDGLVTAEQLAHALAERHALKLPLDQVLVKLNYVPEETMRQTVDLQMGPRERVSPERLQALRVQHEKFVAAAAEALAGYLRTTVECTLGAIEQCTYAEFTAALPDPTAFYAMTLAPVTGEAALEVPPAIAFTAIDRILGGAGQGEPPARPLTDIELNIVDHIVRMLVVALTEVWQDVTPVAFAVRARDVQSQALTVAGPTDMVVSMTIDANVGGVTGALHLCLPMALLGPASTNERDRHAPARETSAAELAWLDENLGRMRLPVAAVLESTIAARDVLTLERGDVLALGVPADASVDLRIADIRKLRVHLVARDRQAVALVDGRCESGVQGEL